MNLSFDLFRNRKPACLVLLVSAAVSCQLSAQLSFTARKSDLAYQWGYGFANQTSAGSGDDLVNFNLMSHGAGMQGDSSDTDIYVPSDHRWSASVNWSFGHGYRVHGQQSDFHAIAASGSANTSANANGASSNVEVSKNELSLEFVCAEAVNMVMRYELTVNGFYPQNRADIWLEVADGSGNYQYVRGWGQIGQMTLDSFVLQPGLYRIRSFAFSLSNAAGQTGASNSAKYFYAFAVASDEETPFITWDPQATPIKVTNPAKTANLFSADVTASTNVDVYRSFNLLNFGTDPIKSNVVPGVGVILDNAALAEKAFYTLCPAGAPAPWQWSGSD